MAKAKKIIQEKKDLTTLDAKELNIELQTARKSHFSLAMKHST